MQKINRFGCRYRAVWLLAIAYLCCSFATRLTLFLWAGPEPENSVGALLKTFSYGFLFDFITACSISLPAILYITLLPNPLIGSKLDKTLTYIFTFLTLFLLSFTALAEFTFWEEFKSRFNFIAVDYLIYTHEVIANIAESYPLPLLFAIVLVLAILGVLFINKQKGFNTAFTSKIGLTTRLLVLAAVTATVILATVGLQNTDAEWSANRYNNELSKNGIYSFFAAFRNNQMKYSEFYITIPENEAFDLVRNELQQNNSRFQSNGLSIHRSVTSPNPSNEKPNVVFILVESLSAKFLGSYGNTEKLTPNLDKLATKACRFTNMFATGTRTVRGMEAVTLCISPTPGQSIVKRPKNAGLYTVSNVFKSKGYSCNFFYGGDGYFDNMDAYFGSNGFNIFDRGRGSILSDDIKTTRTFISDSQVTFENAWGICDEDIYNVMLEQADQQYASGKPFFNFIMTTSNHRPYTYPDGKIDIASGKSRNGAVKYTDYALGKLFEAAQKKPWFKNTVFVIVADHCASSAGKDEIDIVNYKIPAFIIGVEKLGQMEISKQCSQIDLMPTLFGALDWNYESDFFGEDVLNPLYHERALVATYRKLGYIKKDAVVILSDQKSVNHYKWDNEKYTLSKTTKNPRLEREAIAWYQTADYLFNNNKLK
ncbi:alkaline phosphatase family protein [Flavobacterium sp.]|uniref:LTA synthase family protein n=1 Tax=Flavobacterium sp. TaxID=239 RepID=UPI0026218FC2|nr:alkaline phosphatase family protein [Flavobacterium sp.]